MTAMNGPMSDGMIWTSHSAMALTMPVPLRTPVRTAAAMTMLTTATIYGAWAISWAPWSLTLGKLTSSAMAEPTMKTYGSGMTSATSSHHDRDRQAEVEPEQLGTQRGAVGVQRGVGHRGVAVVDEGTSARPATATGRSAAGARRPTGAAGRGRAGRTAGRAAAGAAVEATSNAAADRESPQISAARRRARRLRSCRPSIQAKTSTTTRPAMSDGSMGTKMSLASSFSADGGAGGGAAPGQRCSWCRWPGRPRRSGRRGSSRAAGRSAASPRW